jgi:hypothetical protein
MAGQPPHDGSWQSGPERARAAWQQDPPYEPLAETAKHPVQSYDAPPHGDPGYPPPQHPYAAGPPQGYAPGGPGYEAAGQQTSFDLPSQQEQWQSPGHGQAQARPSAPHGKGFIASLFDFGFTSFVTPRLIKVLYALAVFWTMLVALILTLIGFKINAGAGWSMLILVVPVYVLLSLAGTRVFLELLMGLHRMNDNIQAIRDRDQGQF